LPPQNFTRLPFGQVISDQDLPGNLEECHLFLKIPAKFELSGRHARPEYNGRRNVLSKARVWDRKRGGLSDRRMAHECVIDLTRRNLLTAAIDYIILAAMKREKAILIKAADVPRFKPTIGKPCPIEFWGIEIA
jgi:hypothetical protein